MHTSGLRRRGRPAAAPVVPDWGPNWSPSCGLVTGFAFTRRWLCSSDRECDEYEEGDLAHRGEAISPECLITGKQYIDRWPIHLVGCIPTTSIPTMLGADAEGCSLASGQGRYSRNVWNRQEALRFQRQNAVAEKAAERERKLQETAAGKAQAEQLNADLEARVARLESMLRRGLDREAAIDLNTMLRTDEFPPLDLDAYGVAPPRPVWTPPPEPRVMAGFFGAKYRHDRRVAEAQELFERAERDYERAEAARQQWIRERRARHDAAVQTHQLRLRAITMPWRNSLPACGSGIGRMSSTTWSWRCPERCCPTMFRTRLKWPTRHEESRLSYVSSCRRLMSYQVESYTYVATTATLRKKERPAAKIARLYRSVISQITLLYMRNIFDSTPNWITSS